MIWPANPVGVGSKGHKPAPNKRPRRSPTPPLDPPIAHLPAHSAAAAPMAHRQSALPLVAAQQSQAKPAVSQHTHPALQQPAKLEPQQPCTHPPQPATQQPHTVLQPSLAQQPRAEVQLPAVQPLLQSANSAQQSAPLPMAASSPQLHPQIHHPAVHHPAASLPALIPPRPQPPQLPTVTQAVSALPQPSSTPQQPATLRTLPDMTPAQAVLLNAAQALASPAVQATLKAQPSLHQQIGLAHLAALNSAQGSASLPAAAAAPVAALQISTSAPSAAAAAAAVAAPAAAVGIATPAAAVITPADHKAQSTATEALPTAGDPGRRPDMAQHAHHGSQLRKTAREVQQQAPEAGEPPSKSVKLAPEPAALETAQRGWFLALLVLNALFTCPTASMTLQSQCY